jgi:hypothetical protein
MINQIYHTSHSGSTLLISLLKKNTKAYSEPHWSHKIIRDDSNYIFFIESIFQYDSGTIKLPSGLCHFAHKVDGKKIFLYRQLKQHLFKILFERRTEYVDYYYSYFRKNIHPSLKNIEFDSIDKMNIFLWANRIMWILECQEIAWLNTNDFLLNKKKSLDNVCDYFEIPKVDNISMSNIHAKSIGMNHQDVDLNQITLNMNNAIQVDENYGIISDEVCFGSHQICQLLDWAHKNLFFIPKHLF